MCFSGTNNSMHYPHFVRLVHRTFKFSEGVVTTICSKNMIAQIPAGSEYQEWQRRVLSSIRRKHLRIWPTHTHTQALLEKWCVLSRIRRRLVGETGQPLPTARSPTSRFSPLTRRPSASSSPPQICVGTLRGKRANFVTSKANVHHFISENSRYVDTDARPSLNVCGSDVRSVFSLRQL